ncbi:MAG TPA: PBP1A family penicillin-binding protein [Candidatus Sumerlaeota bacterium]|nr:PBP1A family penicillin-binding protein [Candidatus Sumerlaeota bacterium]
MSSATTTYPGRSRLRRKSRPRRRIRIRFRFRFWRALFALVAFFITLGGAIGAGLFIGYVHSLPQIEQLEHYDPPQVTRVYDRSGAKAIGEFKQENRQVTPINEIPRMLRNAFIAVEDRRFYEHWGVDLRGVIRALVRNIKAGRIVEGASTITIQLAGAILPEIERSERTIGRKVIEAFRAMQIERRYTKDQILEFYLNQIPFSYNAFGVRAAAATYFSKDMADLTIAECATLAGMVKGQSVYNPISNVERSTERRNLVLAKMLENGFITEEEYEAAVKEPMQVRRGFGVTSAYPYFLDGLRRDLINFYGESIVSLGQAGLRISSTIDPAIQEAAIKALRDGLAGNEEWEGVEALWQSKKPERAEEEMKNWKGRIDPGDTYLMQITGVREDELDVRLRWYRGTIPIPDPPPFHNPEGKLDIGQLIDVRVETVDQERSTFSGQYAFSSPVQGSIVVLDAHSGDVLALVGGVNFYNKAWNGQYNRAMMDGRQPGSCFKPFYYAAAFEKGLTPADMIVDEPIEYYVYNTVYRPRNYEKYFAGNMTLIEALEHSRNIPTIRLYEALGPRTANEIVGRFDYVGRSRRWQIPNEYSTPLGTIDCTPLEMAAAYLAFVNWGVGVRPQFFRNAVDANGRIQIPVERKEGPIISPIAAYQTLYLMRQVVRSGTGRRPIGEKFPSPPFPQIAGKTGTTNDNRDAWFCGVTPDLVIVVQIGFDQYHPMGPGMTGGSVAGPVWAMTFREILKTRPSWTLEFTAPPGIVYADICKNTGKRVGPACEWEGHAVYKQVPFKEGTVPEQDTNGYERVPLIQPVNSEYSYFSGQSPRVGRASPASNRSYD